MKYALTLFLLSALAGAQVSPATSISLPVRSGVAQARMDADAASGSQGNSVSSGGPVAQVESKKIVSGLRNAPDRSRLSFERTAAPLERTLIGLHVSSAAFDTGTTVHNLANGCHEDNPLLGSRPSAAHAIGFEAGITAGELIAFHFLRKHHPKLAIAFLGESIVEHGVAGGMNTQQRCF